MKLPDYLLRVPLDVCMGRTLKAHTASKLSDLVKKIGLPLCFSG